MAEEVVKIVVEQEARGTALRDASREADELQKRATNADHLYQQSGGRVSREVASANPEKTAEILKLRTVATGYEAKGMDDAARSARADALRLEGDLRNLTRARVKEESNEAKRRHDDERRHKDEQRRMDAVARAQHSHLRRVGNAASGLAEQATGGTPFGGLIEAAGAFGPMGRAVAAIAVAAATALGVREQRKHNEELSEIENRIETRAGERRRAVLRGPDGGAGASRSAAEEALDERLRREDEREKLKKEAEFNLFRPGTWLPAISGEAEKRVRDNELAIERLRQEEQHLRPQTREQFGDEAGLELEARARRLNFDPRGARDLEHMVLWRREYNRLVKEGADMEQADRGARMAVHEAERTENARFGRIINARSGARDVAMAASLASGEIGSRRDPALVQRIEQLIQTVRSNHAEAMNRKPHNLERPR